LELSEKLNDKFTKGKVYLGLGNFYSNRQIYKALDYANNSLRKFHEIDSLNYESKAYTLIGTIYYYYGNYSKAFENYFESLKINEQLNAEKKLAYDYNNLAIIYSAQNNNKLALEYHFRSLKICQKYGLTNLYSTNLINISTAYGTFDSIEQELRYGKMALDSTRKYGDPVVLSIIILNLGNTYIKLKDFDRAEKYLAEAEGMFNKQGCEYYLNYLYSTKGSLYKEKNETKKAIYYYKLTLKNAQDNDVLELVKEASFELSKIYKSQNQYKEGLFYHEIYHNTSDSIFNVERTKKITEFELQYKFDKQLEIKNREEEHKQKVMMLQRKIIIIFSIALILSIGLFILIIINYRSKKRSYQRLSEQNIQIQKQNNEILNKSSELRVQRDQMKHLNATKDRIYSIIAHDLKNPFNAILGFTSLITENWNDFDDERKILYINKVNESATSAYELLENLLAWARSQTGKTTVNPECIDIKIHVNDTINHIIGQAKSKGIKVLNLVEPSLFIKVDVNMIGSVLRNILSNAIKFTNENGIIMVSSEHQTNGIVSIVIEDNGVGMTEDILSSLFNIETHVSTYGTNNEKGTGLGLLICKDFIEKNSGKIAIESKAGEGTKFIISLPWCHMN